MEDRFKSPEWQELTVYNAPLGKRSLFMCQIPGVYEEGQTMLGVLIEDSGSLTGYSVISDTCEADILQHVSHFKRISKIISL